MRGMYQVKLRRFCRKYGIEIALWNLAWKLHLNGTRKLMENPSDSMFASRKFWDANKDRAKNVMDLFEDELSKEIFKNQIEYRKTYDKKYAVPYDMTNQYFPEDIISLSDSEVFVDCGGYIGDTIDDFLKRTKGNYNHIIVFEPDKNNFDKLCKNIGEGEEHKNIFTFRKGVWSESTVLHFDNNNTGKETFRVSEDNKESVSVEVVALDDISYCRDATFIKMDIEGSEFEALRGASHIIERNRPILAICIYHSDDDMLRIPELIKEKYPDYKLYVRQHVYVTCETVLYAIPCERKRKL